MKTYRELSEEIRLKKKTWQIVKFNQLESEMKDKLWKMYKATYAKIGLHIPDMKKLTSKYKVSWIIDIDIDDQPDAFIIYKEMSVGNKLALLGSDGTPVAKKVLVIKSVELLKTSGWYVEASHKIADIFAAKGVGIEKDFETIKKAVGKSDVEMTDKDDGSYTRQIGSLGRIEKKLFGKPK